MKKIVTLGEIMLRLSTKSGERLFQTDNLLMHYGGAEANVAVSLSQFGHDVKFVSKIPNNPLGAAVERHLKSYSVDTNSLIKGGERLGTYYLESGVGGRSAQVTYDRKYSSFSQLSKEELNLDEIFCDADLFHVTGITLALSPALRELVLLAVRTAKEAGVITSLDFNYRASLWSQQACSEAIKPLLGYIDICFCGELDAVHLLAIKPASESLLKDEKLKYYYEKINELYPNIRYMASTFRTVLSASTNKLQGNIYTKGELFQSKELLIDHIVDRVGGGDAFAAGVMHGILERWPLSRTISFASMASALKHTIHGDCNAFKEEEIMKVLDQEAGKIVR
ncbi:sugar kinase [Neobacillus cucumis]|uniref:sugar kinase n=1 Tax=Neobacillus cucumis TaxID=1740721 RepID=UPI00196546F2|nr:sugar kinase [Neobacillus cucumis]MBM7653640.1 2-dehydro-3-deoxygluconokinase [Neobacillus cucumis]